ncbi:MAG: hypothetical protein U5L11_09635 [Arhodomonas sp.]|nr:hypothetical protein [Arhodomonas sp.]
METREIPLIEGGLERLITPLCGYLRGIEQGVQRFTLRLHLSPRGADTFTVGLLSPSRDPDHLTALGRRRLEGLQLSAPVTAISLIADTLHPLGPDPGGLLADTTPTTREWQGLIEHIAGRLGEDRVSGLGVRADHRPERAWRPVAPGNGATANPPALPRPLWLLQPPRALAIDAQEHPLWHGPLDLQEGPERIETGWWDGADASRDYYNRRQCPRRAAMDLS